MNVIVSMGKDRIEKKRRKLWLQEYDVIGDGRNKGQK